MKVKCSSYLKEIRDRMGDSIFRRRQCNCRHNWRCFPDTPGEPRLGSFAFTMKGIVVI